MANPLTLAELKQTVVEILPTVVEAKSALTAAGASSVSYATDKVVQDTIGFAADVDEGAAKPISDLGAKEWELQYVKLVHAIVATEEFLNTPEGRARAASQVNNAVASLVQSADVAILAGTNPATGAAVTRRALQNLKDNATAVPATGQTDADVVAALRGSKRGNFVLLSDEGFSGLAYEMNTQGMPKYPAAVVDGAFPFWTAKAAHFEVVGLDGKDADTYFRNNVLAYAGDFATISRAFLAPSVRLASEGSIGGVNLLERNMVAYVIEQPFKYYISNPADFSVVKSA